MANGPLGCLLRHLHELGEIRPANDGDAPLLARFVDTHDEAAFAGLIDHYGPMVLGVCRRVLHHAQDAEDAFQATFLVLARKAGSIRQGQALAAWLHDVAYHVALKARARAVRRRQQERQSDPMPPPDPITAVAARELRAVLDEELHRLPDKYRLPLVLCYLQGQTNDEAAQQLGWPKGTVSGRLARARELLRGRLARRGLALSATLLMPALTEGLAPAAMPAALVAATARAAARFAANPAAISVSASVSTLTEGVLKTMFLTKVKAVIGFVLALGLVGTGAGVVTHHLTAGPRTAWGPNQAPPRPAAVARANIDSKTPSFAAPMQQALEAARAVEDANLRTLAFQAVATFQARAGDRKAARQTLMLALKAASQVPVANRWSSVFWVGMTQWEIGDHQAARKTMHEGVKAGDNLKDTDARINALINMGFRQEEIKDKEAAQKTFQLALAAAATIANPTDRDFRIDWVASRQAWAGAIKEALQTVKGIQRPDAQREVYRDIAQAQARAGDIKAALQTVKHIGELNDTQNYTADMAREGIAKAQADHGDVPGALETVKAMTNDWTKVSAYQHIAVVQAKKDRRGALGSLALALQMVQGMQDTAAKWQRLQGIAGAQAQVGDLAGALKTADSIKDPGFEAMARATIATAQARAKKSGDATQSMAKALKLLGQVKNDNGGEYTMERQNQWLARIELVNALVQMNDFPGALSTAKGLGYDQGQANLFRKIARAQTDAGKAADARAWALRLKSRYARSLALLGVADGILKRDKGK